MKERPILFGAPMIRALLAGTKAQTRRIAKWKAREPGINLNFSGLEAGCYANDNPATGWVLRSRDGNGCWNDRTHPLRCPHGAVGDRLWVREGFTHITGNGIRVHYRADGEPIGRDGKVIATEPVLRRWQPSIFMRRSESRITLEVTAVRVERLQAITEEDARAEGVAPLVTTRKCYPSRLAADIEERSYRGGFMRLWDDINGERAAWASNPFVWVVAFKRVNADARAA